MTDIIVIGAGLIGSAAAKYLAAAGVDVALVGPDESSSPEAAEVFASHYDQGRVVRAIDRDEIWSRLAQKAMARFESIERSSGISFHTRIGFLNVGLPAGHPRDSLTEVKAQAEAFRIPVTHLDSGLLARTYPYFSFRKPYEGILEGGPAGHINPRALVRAQLMLLQNHGGALIRDVIRKVKARSGGFHLEGRRDRYISRHVLVCAGAWSRLMPLTPDHLEVDVRAETIVLVPVTSLEAQRLSHMPTLWYTFDWHPILPHAYLVPPVRYPDGQFYIKVGADNDRDVKLDSPAAARAYFRTGGSLETRRNLVDAIAEFLPAYADRQIVSKPCILTYSSSKHPIVEELHNGWFVATAGNGAGAKSSDEIGRLAAEMILGRNGY